MPEPSVPEPRFRFVCAPSALTGAPAGWARDMLREGEVALLGDEGLDAVNAVAHELDQMAVSLSATEAIARAPGRDRDRLRRLAAARLGGRRASPSAASAWARDRGPMTLLSRSSRPAR